MNKKLWIAVIAGVVVAGFCFLRGARESRGQRVFRPLLVGFTNGTLGPHAVFLLQALEDVRRGYGSWSLCEVSYEDDAVWKSWIPRAGSVSRETNQFPSRWWGPQPHEFRLYSLGSNLFGTVSVPATNAASRIVFEVQEARRGLLEEMRKRWRWLRPKSKRRFRMYVNTDVYCVTNEINVPAVPYSR